MEKIALIIGHNARSKGAFSMIVGSEFSFWKNIAEKVKGEIPELVDIYERNPSTNYVTEMKEVLKELKKFKKIKPSLKRKIGRRVSLEALADLFLPAPLSLAYHVYQLLLLSRS